MIILYSPLAYACYLLAYAIFLTILRFMDALQHDYDLVPALGSDADLTKHRGDRGYEESHTSSNLISARHPWLNFLPSALAIIMRTTQGLPRLGTTAEAA